MNAQQAQGQASKWSRRVRIVLFACALLGLVAAAVFWLLNIQPGVFSTLFGASGVIIGLIALIPIFFPPKTPDPVGPQVTVNTPVTVNNVVPPAPINIYNVLPSAQPTPQVQIPSTPQTSFATGSPSQATLAAGLSYANPLSLRSLPLPGGAKHIQRREKNVKEIYARLIEPGISAVALCGIGGVGKSTLASLVFNYAEQERRAARGPFAGEPVLLRINENTSFLELATNIFACVEKPMPPDFASLPPQTHAYALFNTLNTPASAETPRLVILDQFENLLDPQTGRALSANAGVGELLDALNSQPCASRVLLTSRHIPHGTLDNAPACLVLYRVSDLSVLEGIELLRALGVAGDEAMLREAAIRCNGHALSLTLLGTLTLLKENSVSLATLLKDPAYTQLWEGRIEEKLLEKIFNNLPAVSRSLLCAFSVYREAVPVEAALAVLIGVTKERALAILDGLLEQHLVQPQPATGHYLLHPIVASYASRHFYLDESAGGESARNAAHAQAAYYYMQVGAIDNATPGKIKTIAEARPLIEAVWQLCQAEQFQEAYELMLREDLFEKLELWGANAALLELCQLLLSGNWAYTPRQKAFVSVYIAKTSNVLGRKQEALKYQEQALRIYREVGDRRGEGVMLNELGHVYDSLGQKQEALGYFEQALLIHRDMKNRREEGENLNNLGAVYDDLGQKQKALSYYEQALQIHRDVKNRKEEGVTLNNIGLVYDDFGQKQEALGYFEQALRVRREVGDRGGEGVTLSNLGRVYYALEQKQEALGYFEQALRIVREVGNRGGEGTTLWNIGATCFNLDRNDAALACFFQAKHIFEQVQSPSVDSVAGWIAHLRKHIGEEQFAALLAQVELEEMEQVVKRALREMLDEQG